MVDIVGQGHLCLCKGREHLSIKVAQLWLNVVKQDRERLAAEMNYLKVRGEGMWWQGCSDFIALQQVHSATYIRMYIHRNSEAVCGNTYISLTLEMFLRVCTYVCIYTK